MPTDPSPLTSRELVLVADDQIQLRDLLRRMLERRGCAVITASDGVEAVERFSEFQDRIGLVLMDVQMPRMTGIEAGRRIRELSDHPRLVLMSAQVTGLSPELQQALKLHDFLVKPFGAEQLTEVLPASCVGGRAESAWVQ